MGKIEKLKELLEGSTVVGIDESKNDEAVCTFRVESGDSITKFTLYATDLGYWVADIIRNGRYRNMKNMFDSIWNHKCSNKDISHVSEPGLIGYFKCGCGEIFVVNEVDIGDDYKHMLNDSTMEKVAKLLTDGIYFCCAQDLEEELEYYEDRS